MEEETIELRELFEVLVKRKIIIILCTIVAIVAGATYTFMGITPMYKSETTLIVNGSGGSSASDLAASFDLGSIDLNQKLVVTYGEIVKSRIVLEQVIDRLELDVNYNQLRGIVTSQPVNNTEILNVSVEHEDPERASNIANETVDVFIKEVMRILKADNVEIIDKAIPIDEPVNVNPALNIAIALVLGLMIGVFIAFALEYMDNTIKTVADVEKHLELPVLGSIPDFNQIKKN